MCRRRLPAPLHFSAWTWSENYTYQMGNKKEAVIDLKAMQTADGKPIDPSHIYLVGIQTAGSGAVYIDDVFLSMDGEVSTGIEQVEQDNRTLKACEIYTLDGRRVNHPQPGINIIRTADGKAKKVMY